MTLSQRVNLDAESRGIIFQGASVNQLAAIFRIKTEDVMRRLGDLRPVGTGRQGNPIYDLAAAAGRLVPPVITPEMIDGYMRRVNHSHLPPMVSKHYWEGKRVRVRYMEEAGELWASEDVVRVLSETFQSIRMSLMLIPDTLRDEGNLSEAQFRIVQRIIDDSIEDTRVRLDTDIQQPHAYPVRSGSDDEDGAL